MTVQDLIDALSALPPEKKALEIFIAYGDMDFPISGGEGRFDGATEICLVSEELQKHADNEYTFG